MDLAEYRRIKHHHQAGQRRCNLQVRSHPGGHRGLSTVPAPPGGRRRCGLVPAYIARREVAALLLPDLRGIGVHPAEERGDTKPKRRKGRRADSERERQRGGGDHATGAAASALLDVKEK